MGEGYRELPAHIETMLSPRDASLNRLPVHKLLESHRRNEVRAFVDRGLAIQAASSGVPTSGLTTMLSLLFPLLLLAAPLAWYFSSWINALAAVVSAVIVFRASRALIVARVQDYALNNPKLLDLLISKGVIWFEHVTDELDGPLPTTVSDPGNPALPYRKEALLSSEQIFSTDSTG